MVDAIVELMQLLVYIARMAKDVRWRIHQNKDNATMEPGTEDGLFAELTLTSHDPSRMDGKRRSFVDPSGTRLEASKAQGRAFIWRGGSNGAPFDVLELRLYVSCVAQCI
jgi:hypothetical protein